MPGQHRRWTQNQHQDLPSRAYHQYRILRPWDITHPTAVIGRRYLSALNSQIAAISPTGLAKSVAHRKGNATRPCPIAQGVPGMGLNHEFHVRPRNVAHPLTRGPLLHRPR